MKLKFKVQPYQTRAVAAVVDCFNGQPKAAGITYRVDTRKLQGHSLEIQYLTIPSCMGIKRGGSN
jgi:type III restriction enzyme